MNSLERWNDDRLDDLAREVERMSLVVDGIGEMKAHLATAASDAKHARAGVHRVVNDMASGFTALRNDLTARDVARVAEKKSDRRWFIGTTLTIAALLIAAGGILQGAL